MASVTARSTSIMCQRFTAFTIIVAESWTQLTTNSVQESARRNTSSLVKLQWQDPQPLPEDLPAVPPFDYQCLPETLGPWIKDIAERIQCPPDFPAVGAMIALGRFLVARSVSGPSAVTTGLKLRICGAASLLARGCSKHRRCSRHLSICGDLWRKLSSNTKRKLRDHEISAMLGVQRKKILEEQSGNI